MKTLLFCIALVMLAAFVLATPTTNAPSVIIGWSPSPSTNVAGYNLYWGIASRQYTNFATVNANKTQAEVTNLIRGSRYFFAATAWAPNGLESDYSGEVDYLVPLIPNSPTNVHLTIENP